MFHNHTAQNMKLLQKLVQYKSLKIDKNCKEEIIRSQSMVPFSMLAFAANNDMF